MSRTRVRVLLRELPQMLRDILEHAIGTEPGWELMREPGPSPFEFAARPDVIILGTTQQDDLDGAPAVLARWPGSRVLLITENGHYASLIELQPRRTELGEVSTAELVLAIRRAIHQPAGSAITTGADQRRSTAQEQ